MATNQKSLEKDWDLEHKFSRQIKAALGNVFISKDITQDLQRGQDFAIYRAKPFNIAVRLRRNKFLANYANEFTIRWSRPSGVLTEIDKIRQGTVDYFFYGFVSDDETKIVQWFLGDLNIFRTCEPKPKAVFPNNPYDSELAVYNISQFPSEFLIHFYTRNN